MSMSVITIPCARPECPELITKSEGDPKKYHDQKCFGLAISNRVSFPCASEGCTGTRVLYPSDLKKRKTTNIRCDDCRKRRVTPEGRKIGTKPKQGWFETCAYAECTKGKEGQPGKVWHTPSKHPKCCSTECARLIKLKRVERSCENCGILFYVRPSALVYGGGKFHSEECFKDWRRKEAYGRTKETSDGYVLVCMPDHPNAQPSTGWVLEHVKIMAEILGRPLVDKEEVHHKNGKRNDNRPENLELWNTSQPAGQRPEDKLKYAEEIFKLYAPERLA